MDKTLFEISAKADFSVAAVCDRRRFSKFTYLGRSQSAATGLLQSSLFEFIVAHTAGVS
jgi:hypothetical protein